MQVFDPITKEISGILWVQNLANLGQISNIHNISSLQKFVF